MLKDLVKVLAIADKFYLPIAREFGDGKEYGCLAIRGPLTQKHPIELRMPFGTIPESSRCYTFALEKVTRLTGFSQHWASYESRNVARQEYGGAIRLPETSLDVGFMGWSSFPEKVDEAFVLSIAVRAHLMELDRAKRIAQTTGNEFFQPVLARMGIL